jgi:hypothetical protein
VLPRRLAKTKALQDVNRLKIALKGKEVAQHAVNSRKKAPEEEKEARCLQLYVWTTCTLALAC